MDLTHLLRGVELFHGLIEEDLNQIADVFQEHYFHPGDLIARQGAPGDALFLVIFRTQKGTIEASYDWSGDVVETIERFRNLMLPRKILLSGMKSHSGWRVIGTNYYVYYLKDRTNRVLYTIYISNGRKKKRILLDSEGTVL